MSTVAPAKSDTTTLADPSVTGAGPLLTRVDVHGFKSFATRTTFQFERGITAIIGPNGSGKSNISDAVRWVLGETSQSSLRGRKTEDVIFAGGSGRAPSGMAEVTVTFDNTTGWLPISFAEVTVTRRAFRSGESQYLINGKRVRLKDVHGLVASLGQSHTVVGQGLIDAALSQRPEERRGLFEHAADLTGLRLKAVETERSLAEADANTTRLEDLLGELEPRLKLLERAARQAREWHTLNEQLRALQTGHYRRLYRGARADLTATEQAAAAAATIIAEGETHLATIQERVRVAAETLQTARHAAELHAARVQSVSDDARRVAHERDLAGERLAALTRRREDMIDTRDGLEEQSATAQAELRAVSQTAADLERGVLTARQEIEALRSELAGAVDHRLALDTEVAHVTRAIRDLDRRAGDLARRRALLEQRQELDDAERIRADEGVAARAERLRAVEKEIAAIDDAAEKANADIAERTHLLASNAEQTTAAAHAVMTARDQARESEQRLNQARARLEAMRRVQESGTGLFAGVRAVLQAGRRDQLTGVRGTVADVVTLPARYDTAIEVALGGHLQDIVVERWADAETAIQHLKRTNSGRVTFQPIDTVGRRFRDRRGLPEDVSGQAGVHGVASELVTADADLRGIVQALLGPMVVVDDLAVARRILPDLPLGWSAVTLSGEIARTGGSVTGGAATRESGTLARNRELRELPGEIDGLEQRRLTAQEALATAEAEARRREDEGRALEAKLATQRTQANERGTQRKRLVGWFDELRREQDAAERQAAGLVAALVAHERAVAEVITEETALTAERAALRDRDQAVSAALSAANAANADAERTLADRRRDFAAIEERLRSERRRQASILARERSLSEELALRGERVAGLDGEIRALTEQRDRLTTEAERLEQDRQGTTAEQAPLLAAVRAADADHTTATRAQDAVRAEQLTQEHAATETRIALERVRGQWETLITRIREELALDDPERLLHESLPNDDTALSADETARTEREISRLKDRLRRTGYAGDDAVSEYERESERQIFLREQLADVQAAAANIRVLLVELRETMRERFQATFSRVAAVFSETFTVLFGGGTARLVLAGGEGDEGPPGIDIVAQPPGKRLQTLALLSGGERALTAAALLIAILRVNPTPFCLLDEVDAALDEANVVRFREQLRVLAVETQVIVITHNRGTIEIADTLYGVSMGDDGVSRVLSMRMPEQLPYHDHDHH